MTPLELGCGRRIRIPKWPGPALGALVGGSTVRPLPPPSALMGPPRGRVGGLSPAHAKNLAQNEFADQRAKLAKTASPSANSTKTKKTKAKEEEDDDVEIEEEEEEEEEEEIAHP